MEMQLCQISQAELQQELQRFTGLLSERVEQAAELLKATRDPRQMAEALHRVLLYESSALEIATGQLPEANLLDMVVFVTLSRDAFEQHWLPHVFGAAGRELLEALTRCESDLWTIASKLLTPSQAEQLTALIRAWQEENPGQVHVETVRLSDFSKLHGSATRKATSTGLLAGVRSATRAADDAMRLGERALFLAQRAPFAARLQVRVGVLELMADGLEQVDRLRAAVERSDALLTRLERLRPLLTDAAALTERAQALSHEARLLTNSLGPVTELLAPRVSASEGRAKPEQLLTAGNQLAERGVTFLRELRALAPEGPASWAHATVRVDGLVRRWILQLTLMGIAWLAVFWLGYALTR